MTVLNPERIGVAYDGGSGIIAAIYERCFKYVQERDGAFLAGRSAASSILQNCLADTCINLENCAEPHLQGRRGFRQQPAQPYHPGGDHGQTGSSPKGRGMRQPMVRKSSVVTASAMNIQFPCLCRDAYQIQFSPISNEISRNMLMQFQDPEVLGIIHHFIKDTRLHVHLRRHYSKIGPALS